MSKKATRLICILLAVLMVFGVAAYALSAGAFAVTQAEIDALQKQRDAIRDQQKDVQEQIDALNDEMAGVIERKTALDQQNELNRQDVELINEQIELYDQMIEDKEAELDQAIQNEEDQFEHYCARVRTMEERSTLSYVSILLKATSLSDFLSRLNDIMDIVRNDQNVKAEYIAAREQVEEVKAEYETVQEEQKEKRTELLEEKERLEEQIDAACKIIAQLEDDIEEYKAMYEENEALEAEVQAKIDEKVAALQKQKEEEERARQAYLEQLKRQQQSSSGGGSTGGGTTSAGFIWPVSSCTYITSKFGYRVHPIFGTTKYHSGVDIAAGYGATITAAAGGTVTVSEYSSSYGNYCVIYHSNGLTTLYAHMNALPSVSVGDTVSQGQVIGYVGSTGRSTGPHLDFRVWKHGSPINPLKMQSPPAEPLRPAFREQFDSVRVLMDRELEAAEHQEVPHL